MVGCKYLHLSQSAASRASQRTAMLGSCLQSLLPFCPWSSFRQKKKRDMESQSNFNLHFLERSMENIFLEWFSAILNDFIFENCLFSFALNFIIGLFSVLILRFFIYLLVYSRCQHLLEVAGKGFVVAVVLFCGFRKMNQMSHIFFHLWLLALNLQICLFHLEFIQKSGNYWRIMGGLQGRRDRKLCYKWVKESNVTGKG